MIDKANLDVQTHMSETVFLDPVPDRNRTVWIGARNTSDHPEIDVKAPLTQKLFARGYEVVGDPQAAHFLIQSNVLQAGRWNRCAGMHSGRTVTALRSMRWRSARSPARWERQKLVSRSGYDASSNANSRTQVLETSSEILEIECA